MWVLLLIPFIGLLRADAFGPVSAGNVSGRWLQATNGKSSAEASMGMSRNMLAVKGDCAQRCSWTPANTSALT